MVRIGCRPGLLAALFSMIYISYVSVRKLLNSKDIKVLKVSEENIDRDIAYI